MITYVFCPRQPRLSMRARAPSTEPLPHGDSTRSLWSLIEVNPRLSVASGFPAARLSSSRRLSASSSRFSAARPFPSSRSTARCWTILDVPHLVALVPQELANEAETLEDVLARLGGAVIFEVADRSPQLAQILAERNDDAD
jgi:hypothetical protein